MCCSLEFLELLLVWTVKKLYNKLKFSQEDGDKGDKNSFKILFKEKRWGV